MLQEGLTGLGHVPLHINPRSVTWKDGSCIKPVEVDDPEKLGAAERRCTSTHRVHAGCTNTIQRAELAAIRRAIASQKASTALIMTTDSKASLDLIKKTISNKEMHMSM